MDSKDIFVTRSSMPSFEEYCAQIAPLWESHLLTNAGPLHHELEQELKAYLGVRHCALFVNGHNALECILETFELKGEIITTPFTFASTTHAIVRAGCKPVMCDVRPDDFTLDPKKVEALITPRTCAILPVHVYGNLCDNDALQDIADRYGLRLIYDAAHAFGVRKDGKSVAGWGDASMLSFHATNVFNTIEGGAVCLNGHGIKERLTQWRNFGITGPEDVGYVGGNAKMNEFAAAMGICNLRHVDEEIDKRRKVHEAYMERLEGVSGLTLPSSQLGVTRNYAYFPVLFDGDAYGVTRDEVFEALAKRGIHARKYFYPLVSDYACYAGCWDSADTPIAKRAAERVLTLPMYADLAIEDVYRICDIVLESAKA